MVEKVGGWVGLGRKLRRRRRFRTRGGDKVGGSEETGEQYNNKTALIFSFLKFDQNFLFRIWFHAYLKVVS